MFSLIHRSCQLIIFLSMAVGYSAIGGSAALPRNCLRYARSVAGLLNRSSVIRTSSVALVAAPIAVLHILLRVPIGFTNLFEASLFSDRANFCFVLAPLGMVVRAHCVNVVSLLFSCR